MKKPEVEVAKETHKNHDKKAKKGKKNRKELDKAIDSLGQKIDDLETTMKKDEKDLEDSAKILKKE